MNLIADTWRGLVRRRLWPLAVVLVAALVAVPFLLAKSPAPAAPAPLPVAKAPSGDALTTSYVTLAQPSDSTPARRRRVLGAQKDPFAPAPTPVPKHKKKAAVAAPATATPTPTSTPAASSGNGGGASAPTSMPTPVPTPAGPTVPKDTLEVRWGAVTDAASSPLASSYLEPLSPLGSDAGPITVYERLTNKDRTAVFSIPGEVAAVGDGRCEPTPQDCETLKLHAHDTEFLTVSTTAADGTVTSALYQLDLVKIFTKKTVVPAASLTSVTAP
jgi:hypothetical protein